MLIARLKRLGRIFKQDLAVYKLVIKDRRTPMLGKIFLASAVGYALLPFDLIPDFIPIIGHVDDVIIVPFLVIIALKLIPREIVEEHRTKIRKQNTLYP